MRTPDIRPITILTRSILDSAPAWMIIASNSFPDQKPVHRVEHVLSAQIKCRHDSRGTSLWVASNSGWHISPATCYPCEATPPFAPLPWPILPGEEEIEEWNGYHYHRRPAFRKITDIFTDPRFWVLVAADGTRAVTAKAMPDRPGLHPAPRSRIEPDGSVITVWVWEKDR